MKTDNTEELRQLTSLVAKRASSEEVAQKAREIKTRLVTTWAEIMRTVSLLDSLVATFAPGEPWQAGLSYSSAPVPVPFTPRMVIPVPHMTTTAKGARVETVLRIAKEFGAKEPTVTSKQIAARLRSEGDQRPEKSVVTSVSNILARSKKWNKVHPGEYGPIDEKEEAKHEA